MSGSPHERYEDSRIYRVRHSAAHVMAQAVLEMFPDAKIAIGPAVEDGFYYDFDLPRTLTPQDLEAIEKRMREIIREGHPFQRQEVSADEARARFSDQPYKLELIDELERGGMDVAAGSSPFTRMPRSATCAAVRTWRTRRRSTPTRSS
jgi:threonyl-tRNA synthetase